LTEGPYYTPGSPERISLLEPGVPGSPITLTGRVLDTNCKPIAGAWIDFWQTDGDGVYDNAGYKLRGHQFTDKDGNYRLQTVMPGEYPGRTLHIHVKVKAPGGPELTSQLFFPRAAGNATDGIFSDALVVRMTSTDSAVFDFVVRGN
jgi:protocatechuate 3,4-dioxygenase beta subunit